MTDIKKDWLKGMGLSGSQVDYLQFKLEIAVSQAVEEFAKKVEEEVIGKNGKLKSTWDRETMTENSLKEELRQSLQLLVKKIK